MNFVRNTSIAAKIGVVVALFVLLACCLVGVGAYGLKTNDDTVQDMYSNQVKALYLSSDAREKASHMHQRAFEVIVESDKARWDALQSAFSSEVDGLRRVLDDMKPSLDDGDMPSYNLFKPEIENYEKAEQHAFDLQKSGQRSEAEDQIQGDVNTIFESLSKGLAVFASKQLHDLDEAHNNVHDLSRKTLISMVATGFAGLFLTMVVALLLVRSQISRPINAMTQAMSRLARGDTSIAVPALGQTNEIGAMAGAVQSFKDAAIAKLKLESDAVAAGQRSEAERAKNEAERASAAEQQTAVVEGIAEGLERLADGDLVFRLQTSFAPEYEKLRTDFNSAMDKLGQTMAIVATKVSAIRAGTTEISTAANDLSRRTEQQAASLEETAAALDEITATVKKTSEGSIQARQVVVAAKADAERSGGVVGKAVEAMSAIEQSSTKVSQIIGVIDEIAFQTNLLALNAGVEAARAGEAGRGFAVVASEVRALAQRSAEAAKEIKALISTSSQQVSEGVSLVSETGTALTRIATQVTEINAVVLNIATSTQEQATALQEVNTAINQMDQVTQQNAAMVEESTAASRNLATETEELAQLVGQFQIGTGVTGGSALARRPAAVARPASRPVTALKTTTQRAVARMPAPQDATWEEF